MSGDGTELRTGRLLVATPALLDPNFARTVVLLLDHDEDGTVGVVLNRPTDLMLETGLPGWERLAAYPPVVFLGGPVSPSSAVCLGRARPAIRIEGFRPVAGRLGILDPERDVDELAAGVESARVCAGYAGWGAGQLDDEIAEGAWWVVDLRDEDVTASEPETLWQRVLRRQPPPLSWASLAPVDPTLN
ncbi:MAG TPA: YqgE/AlgH family protein [Mycobacteriales bacterium]|nr:YqgE/AlgH family protein [Mycobacteriales bacterium]